MRVVRLIRAAVLVAAAVLAAGAALRPLVQSAAEGNALADEARLAGARGAGGRRGAERRGARGARAAGGAGAGTSGAEGASAAGSASTATSSLRDRETTRWDSTMGSDLGGGTDGGVAAEDVLLDDLEGPPKVALLFLARGPLPLEPAWAQFFQAAGAVEPAWGVADDGDGADAGGGGTGAAVAAAAVKGAAAASDGEAAAVGTGTTASTGDAEESLHAVGDARDANGSLAGASKGRGATGDASSASSVASLARRLRRLLGKDSSNKSRSSSSSSSKTGRSGKKSGLRKAHRPSDSESAVVRSEGKSRTLFRIPAKPEQRASIRTALRIDGYNERVWGRLEAPASALSPRDPLGPIARQRLFSVYVHTTPSFAFLNSSVFSGYQIGNRVYARWGQWSIAEAERRLLRAALRDPRNQAFAVLSESCAPIVPPHALHAQLLWEAKSRVDACGLGFVAANRWRPAMAAKVPKRLWRKSSQWLSLTRRHAALVAGDEDLWPLFEQECYSHVPGTVNIPPYLEARGANWTDGRDCVPDEHYIPTLIAIRGETDDASCEGFLTHSAWPDEGWSPRVYDDEAVRRDLLRDARTRRQGLDPPTCSFDELEASIRALYAKGTALATLSGEPRDGVVPLVAHDDRVAGMPTDCPLFARKIAPAATGALVDLGRDCERGTAIDATCIERTGTGGADDE